MFFPIENDISIGKWTRFVVELDLFKPFPPLKTADTEVC